jgi:PEGA domain
MGVSAGARARGLLAGLGLAALACQAHRSTVPLTVERAADAPRDASVYIDEQFVGLLGVVAARGVRLPEGAHRITVEKVGYFPWDQRVVSDRQPIVSRVELRRIPE